MDFNNKESIRQFALEDFQNRFSDTYEQNKRQINGFFNSYFGAKKSTGVNVKDHLAPAGLADDVGIQRLNTFLNESISGINPNAREEIERIVSPLEAVKSRGIINTQSRTPTDYSSNYGTLSVSEGSGPVVTRPSSAVGDLNITTNGRYSYSGSGYSSTSSNAFLYEQNSIKNVVGEITKDPSRPTNSANDFSMLDSQPLNEKPPENLKPAPKVSKQLLDQKKIELPDNIKPLSGFKFTKAPDNIGPIDRLALPKNTNSTISNKLSSAIDHLPNQGNIQPTDNIKNITTPVGNVVGKVVENLFEQSDNKIPENIENLSNGVNTLLIPNNRPSNDPIHGISVNNGVSSLSDLSTDATNNGDYNNTVRTSVNPAKSSGAYSQNSNNTTGTYASNTIASSQKTPPFKEPVTYTDLNTESTGNSVYAQNGAAASVNRTPLATGAPRGSSLSNNTTPQIDIEESPGTFKDKLKQHWNDYKEYRADQEVDFISSKRMDQVGPGKEFETENDLRGHIKNTFMDSSSADEAEKLLDKESMDRIRGEYPGWLETSPKQRLVSKTAIQREKKPVSKEGSLLDRVLRRNVDPSDKKRTITDKLMGRGGSAEPVQDLRGSHEYITEQYDNGNPYLTDKNARFLDRKGVRMSVEQAANEAAKDQGTGLGKFSSQTGWNHSLAQARAASVGERTNAFLNSANILGGSSRESLLNSIGMLTADQKVQIAKAGGLNKIFTQGGVALGGVFTAGYALQSEDVGNEMIASTAASWGIMQGWRAGRDFGSILRASHVTRVGFGAVGAASTAALGYGAIKAFSDLTSNESFIVDAAKNFASKEIFSKNQESDLALTLRQRSIQKLASSALNNRGQLLGNEAQVLKGVGIHG